MRREGHKALVHTAAASNLGQMLNKICLKDGIGLVNIVRSAEQAEILREIGAKHVVDSTAPTLHGRSDQGAGRDRRDARLRRHRRRQAGRADPRPAWRSPLNKTAKVYSRYGSSVHKQVYIYGGLDHAADRAEPRVRHGLGRRRLAAVSVPAEDRAGRRAPSCAQRVVAELKTTFASHYTQVVSLQEALQLDAHRRLRQARDRREVPDQSEQGLTNVKGGGRSRLPPGFMPTPSSHGSC